MTRQQKSNFQHLGNANNLQRQAGMTMIGMVFILTVAIFIGLCAFKIGPAYSEYWTVSRLADKVAADKSLLGGTKSKVYERLAIGFRQNNLWDAVPKEMITLTKDKTKGMQVHVNYERRAQMFGNIYVVTKFDRIAGDGNL